MSGEKRCVLLEIEQTADGPEGPAAAGTLKAYGVYDNHSEALQQGRQLVELGLAISWQATDVDDYRGALPAPSVEEEGETDPRWWSRAILLCDDTVATIRADDELTEDAVRMLELLGRLWKRNIETRTIRWHGRTLWRLWMSDEDSSLMPELRKVEKDHRLLFWPDVCAEIGGADIRLVTVEGEWELEMPLNLEGGPQHLELRKVVEHQLELVDIS